MLEKIQINWRQSITIKKRVKDTRKWKWFKIRGFKTREPLNGII